MSAPEQQEWHGIVSVTVEVPVTVYTEGEEDEDYASDLAHEQAHENLPYGLKIMDSEVELLEQVSA